MQNRPSHRVPAARAFTLLEVMIVIVIILAILGLVTVNLMGTKKTADTKLVQVQLGALKGALDLFYLEYNRYPTEEEGLAVLWNKDGLPEEDQTKWHVFTKEPLPRDSWGSPWGYRVKTGEGTEGTTFEIWSYGADKEDGTADDVKGTKATTDDGTGPADTGPPPPTGRGG